MTGAVLGLAGVVLTAVLALIATRHPGQAHLADVQGWALLLDELQEERDDLRGERDDLRRRVEACEERERRRGQDRA